MSAEKKHFTTYTITEQSLPFSNTTVHKYESFYYDRSHRDGADALTNGHYHNMYEIYFLLSGHCRYFIENKLFEINEGDIVLIPKGIIHKTLYTDVPTDRYLINFSKPYITPSLAIDVQNLFVKNVYHAGKSHIQQITAIFEKIALESKSSDEYSKMLITGCMTELFVLMLRHPSSEDTYSQTNIPIEFVTQYITAHYRENLTLSQMAKMSSLSESYFSRLFKAITGFGFKEYLTIIRIKAAQSLLLHTDTSICKVAYECGFNDSNYFSSVFKELNGISPLRYRKQNRITSKKSDVSSAEKE